MGQFYTNFIWHGINSASEFQQGAEYELESFHKKAGMFDNVGQSLRRGAARRLETCE